jgi:hypothetical protein
VTDITWTERTASGRYDTSWVGRVRVSGRQGFFIQEVNHSYRLHERRGRGAWCPRPEFFASLDAAKAAAEAHRRGVGAKKARRVGPQIPDQGLDAVLGRERSCFRRGFRLPGFVTEREIPHCVADEPGLLALTVEHFKRSGERPLIEESLILELSVRKTRNGGHSKRPGTSTPFSTCAGT